jgi:Cu/Ag efflux pump CusA
MSRKSAAALSVVVANIDGRPRAPDDLTEFQVVVWDRTVANESADTFKTAALQQILKEYCRHVETADRLSRKVDRATEEGSNMPFQEVESLIRMRARETSALTDKATKLRLTNQSRYTPGAAATASKNAGGAAKPWQSVG